MDSGGEDHNKASTVYSNQPFDESLEVQDSEEIASQYTPSPRYPGSGMDDLGEDAGGRARQERPPQNAEESGDEEEEEEDSEEEDDDDDDDSEGGAPEGAYDPADYEHLAVSAEIKDLFSYITRYTPQKVELEHRLRPFIPDYIPAVGDIDAFLKVPRPDNRDDDVRPGLSFLDEPSSQQSEKSVLELMLRAQSKQATLKEATVNRIEDADKNVKEIDKWIKNVEKLHKMKAPPTVHYSKNMPDIDQLMQEWPPEIEEMLKDLNLPTADLDCTLRQYTDIICAMLDIPIYENRIQSLHVLFTLFSEFKNSQHFKSLAEENKLDNALKGQSDLPAGVDRLEI